MIETCTLNGCFSVRKADSPYCSAHDASMSKQILPKSGPPQEDPKRHGRRNADIREGENSGGDVDYYRVHITDPKRSEVDPYMAECEDIIEHLGMTFAEGSAFKSIWRKAAQRTLGHMKRGNDQHGIRDSEKVEYYGKRMIAQAQREARKETAIDVRNALVGNLQK